MECRMRSRGVEDTQKRGCEMFCFVFITLGVHLQKEERRIARQCDENGSDLTQAKDAMS